MNLSPELMAHIGETLRDRVAASFGTPLHRHDRELTLEWVKAIEAAYREEVEREADESGHMLARLQGG